MSATHAAYRSVACSQVLSSCGRDVNACVRVVCVCVCVCAWCVNALVHGTRQSADYGSSLSVHARGCAVRTERHVPYFAPKARFWQRRTRPIFRAQGEILATARFLKWRGFWQRRGF